MEVTKADARKNHVDTKNGSSIWDVIVSNAAPIMDCLYQRCEGHGSIFRCASHGWRCFGLWMRWQTKWFDCVEVWPVGWASVGGSIFDCAIDGWGGTMVLVGPLGLTSIGGMMYQLTACYTSHMHSYMAATSG